MQTGESACETTKVQTSVKWTDPRRVRSQPAGVHVEAASSLHPLFTSCFLLFGQYGWFIPRSMSATSLSSRMWCEQEATVSTECFWILWAPACSSKAPSACSRKNIQQEESSFVYYMWNQTTSNTRAQVFCLWAATHQSRLYFTYNLWYTV